MRFLMTTTLLVFLLLGLNGPIEGQPNSGRSTADDSAATLYVTKGDIQAFSRRLDDAATLQELLDATTDLTALYLRIVADPRFSRSKVLQANRGRIAAKLQQAVKRIKRSGAETDQVDPYDLAAEPVMQTSRDQWVARVVDQQLCLSAHAVGATGPAMYFASGMHGTSGYFNQHRRAGNPGDLGPALLQLIQSVIHPDFWNVNGGSGRAHYYRAQRVLVVTATMRVHEDMTSLLSRLR